MSTTDRWKFFIACAVALAGTLLLVNAPATPDATWWGSRMLSIHTLLELFCIVVACLVVTSAWHTFDQAAHGPANVFIVGFILVVASDVMHVLSYKGMPMFLIAGTTPHAIFYWLAGRSFETATLFAVALGLTPRVPRSVSLVAGIACSVLVVWFGTRHLDLLPATFIEGVGVTPFKARFEYALFGANMVLTLILLFHANRTGSKDHALLALSSFLMGLGGLAFTAYKAPSDLQNIAGHAYKMAAYALLYRAIFRKNIEAPYLLLKRSEAQVRASQAHARTLGANLVHSVVYQLVRHRDGRLAFTEVTESIEHIVGITAESVLADPGQWIGLIHRRDKRQLDLAEIRSRLTGTKFDVEVRMIRPDGQERTVHFVAAPRAGEDGSTVWDGIATDITERVESDRTRRRLETQLNQSQKMESIGRLASGIAHDFNNVLAAIIGNTNMAIEDVKAGARDEALLGLAQIRKSGTRARALVNQILSFSRREAPERLPQQIRPIIEESLALLRSTLPRSVALQENFDDGCAHALVERTQIEQVVLNLCTNAWHALGEKGGRIGVSTSIVEIDHLPPVTGDLLPGRYIRLTVEDNGSGMDEATRQRVFEPFFTTKGVGRGTGLGLSIVHGIVVAHDGTITLDSSLGGGTRFDIFLPVVSGEMAVLPASPHAGISLTQGNGERVLYIDDDDVMARMIERMLVRVRYKVSVSPDPQQGLALLRDDPSGFDVVVTDFNMPGMSGIEVIQAVRAIDGCMPVVLISGYVDDELREKCRQLGIDTVLEKQKSLDELAFAIEKVIEAGDLARTRRTTPA